MHDNISYLYTIIRQYIFLFLSTFVFDDSTVLKAGNEVIRINQTIHEMEWEGRTVAAVKMTLPVFFCFNEK